MQKKIFTTMLLISITLSCWISVMSAAVSSRIKVQPPSYKNHRFTGKPVSLNFQRINLRAVLQLLADFTGINIVVSDKVQGHITLRLNNIPWDEALDIILKTHGLVQRRNGNVMLVDTKASLDKMQDEQFEKRQKMLKFKPVHSELVQINYAKAADILALINDKQNSLLSAKGKISVDARTNTVWIQDTDAKITALKELIRQFDIPVKQVQIEARIVQVTRDFSRDLGIQWGMLTPVQKRSDTENPQERGGLSEKETLLNRRLNFDLAALSASSTVPASMGIALAKLGNGILLDLELSALESEGRARLISSPRLITINQQPAVIESGQEIPYQESTSGGATAVSFKKAVLSLKVTPQITSDNKILMELQINQDTPSSQLFNGVPAISTREIQTHVLINNGQTIVLGGIFEQNKKKALRIVPFFGELPVLGVLFRTTQINLNNQELLIFITPRIITN